MRFAAAESVEGLAEGEVTEADRFERRKPLADRGKRGGGVASLRGSLGALAGLVVEKRNSVGHAGREQVGDGAILPANREHLGLKAAAFADGARYEDIGEKLHLDAFVAEALAMIAAAFAGVEGKTRSVETRSGRSGRGRVELANEFPGFGVERGIGAGRA